MGESMAVIHPGLFLIMQRYPAQKDALRRMYLSNPSFQTLCEDYEKCSQALEHWTRSGHGLAPKRSSDYQELLQGLEREIEEFMSTIGE
jgi:uncharacterized protein YozE (UPF0346 family)